MQQTILYLALAGLVVVALVLAGACVVLLRKRPLDTAQPWLAEKAALDIELAVEKERASRIPGLEEELGQARAARELAEQELASLREAKSRLEADKAAGAAEIERLSGACEAANRVANSLNTELATLREALEQERAKSARDLALLLEAKEGMTKEFQVLANDLMSKHGESFTKQNKDQLDVLLTPLRDKLKEFQEGLQRAHEDTGKERATLAEQIRNLSEQSAKMGVETLNLTRALKGSAQMQGAWGEMILETLLEKSGLREGEEYSRQDTHATDEGGRVRTDVIVNLPGGQHVIIDSKVSMVSFEAYVNAETEEERAINLGAHVVSMRNHIKGLAGKEYHSATGSGLDYVIMFVPIEGALAAALQREPTLTSYAAQNNVAIGTPTTLMIALRTIENVWKVERRNQNAEAIAERAGHLYGKFVGFVEDMQRLGQRLNQAQTSYIGAMGKLQNGAGNLIGQAEKLKELGAKTTRSIPKGLLIDEGLSEIGVGDEPTMIGAASLSPNGPDMDMIDEA